MKIFASSSAVECPYSIEMYGIIFTFLTSSLREALISFLLFFGGKFEYLESLCLGQLPIWLSMC